jgi:hypothetical protein
MLNNRIFFRLTFETIKWLISSVALPKFVNVTVRKKILKLKMLHGKRNRMLEVVVRILFMHEHVLISIFNFRKYYSHLCMFWKFLARGFERSWSKLLITPWTSTKIHTLAIKLSVPYRCSKWWLNSLSQPLQFSHFIPIVKILVAVRLGWELCMFIVREVRWQ